MTKKEKMALMDGLLKLIREEEAYTKWYEQERKERREVGGLWYLYERHRRPSLITMKRAYGLIARISYDLGGGKGKGDFRDDD